MGETARRKAETPWQIVNIAAVILLTAARIHGARADGVSVFIAGTGGLRLKLLLPTTSLTRGEWINAVFATS